MRKETFVAGEYYHIYNRGVDQRIIFRDNRDKIRFTHTLHILNNFLDLPQRFDVYTLEPHDMLTPIEPYVEIVAGCLMSNHYHLMLTPKRENGVSKFLHKIGTSHTKYFNTRYERKGRLFESTYKARHVDTHEYAQYLTQYIHLNPAAMFQAKLGTNTVFQRACQYNWSSLPDYIGGKSAFSLLLSPNFQKDILNQTTSEYRTFTHELFNSLFQAKLGTSFMEAKPLAPSSSLGR